MVRNFKHYVSKLVSNTSSETKHSAEPADQTRSFLVVMETMVWLGSYVIAFIHAAEISKQFIRNQREFVQTGGNFGRGSKHTPM